MISKMFARSINNFYWPLLIKESKHSVRCKQIFLSTTIHTTYRKERQWCSISIHAAMYQLWAENKVAASPNILFYLAGVHACCHFTFYPGCFVEIIQLIFIEPKNEQKKKSTLLLWYLKSKYFHLFFGRIEDTKKTLTGL